MHTRAGATRRWAARSRRATAVVAMAMAALVPGAARSARAQASPAGLWNTISDRDGSPTAVVEIRLVGGEYRGTIRAVLGPGVDSTAVCDDCRGDRKGQRIVGMEILRGMRADGDEWSGGNILDPETGKVYRATMRLEDGGRVLVVRGYVGFSLFGRSQRWTRRDPATRP